ncbi:hypothetical protein [Synechococcus sp. CC9311]|uniref:hypothetical protein n=1 Tax=Synechococcus sp. (strain CC9311) TaxID=64471 RepID=UPI0000DDB3C1|nr:hypothetical protein [Synechococcus sp. CC9311]ABI46376.1 conserved hypothetical protein [Synechococcus sp. CC9311]
MTSSQWLTLSNLGHRFGLSAKHCGHALDHQGWRDRNGHPTETAITAGAAQRHNNHHHSPSNRWNADICSTIISPHGHHPINRSEQIAQWVTLLEAMEEGSASVSTSLEQMAEDLPLDLIEEVNLELSNRGCRFQVQRLEESSSL